jgi:hypothetical protein
LYPNPGGHVLLKQELLDRASVSERVALELPLSALRAVGHDLADVGEEDPFFDSLFRVPRTRLSRFTLENVGNEGNAVF